MIDRTVLTLLAGCVALGAVIVFELRPETPDARPLETSPPVAAVPPLKPTSVSRASDLLPAILAAPLFSATRHPPEAPTVAAGTPELPDVRLSGIVIEPDRRLAIFAVPGGKALVRAEGEALNGWRLDSISAMEVSLSGPGGTRTLEPRPDRNLVRPSTATAAAPAAPVAAATAPPAAHSGGTPLLAAPLSPMRPLGPAAGAGASSLPRR